MTRHFLLRGADGRLAGAMAEFHPALGMPGFLEVLVGVLDAGGTGAAERLALSNGLRGITASAAPAR